MNCVNSSTKVFSHFFLYFLLVLIVSHHMNMSILLDFSEATFSDVDASIMKLLLSVLTSNGSELF